MRYGLCRQIDIATAQEAFATDWIAAYQKYYEGRKTRQRPTALTAGPAHSPNPVGANGFSTKAQAKARCPTDTVVWVNLSQKYTTSAELDLTETQRTANTCVKVMLPQRACALPRTRRTPSVKLITARLRVWDLTSIFPMQRSKSARDATGQARSRVSAHP